MLIQQKQKGYITIVRFWIYKIKTIRLHHISNHNHTFPLSKITINIKAIAAAALINYFKMCIN